MDGAELLLRTLVAGDVTTCFGNPGTSEMSFVAALDRVPDMRCVLGLFEGVVTEDEDDHIRIASVEAGCDIYVSHGVDCAPQQTLWYAVRPEKLVLSRERPEGDANFTRGMVEDVAYLGDMSVFRIVLDSGKRVQATQTNSSRYDQDAISWDEKVYISWASDAGAVLTQ